MGSLKEVRNRITSVKSTQQITRAMKVVAAAKLRRAQQRIVQMRPYAHKLQDLLSHLSGSLEGSDVARFYEVRPVRKVLVITVTSDRGLAGSFNSQVIKESFKLITEQYSTTISGGTVDFITVGKKARDYYRKQQSSIVSENVTIFTNLTYEAAEQIATFAMTAYLKGDYDAVDIVYNRFKNAAIYLPTVERFLPIPIEEEKKEEKGVKNYVPDYIFEPGKEEIITRLINQSLKINFFRTLLESNAAENGARMTAMDKATDNAEDLIRALKLQYNKERQASITKEILEIVGGAQALNN
ncbi:MAG: ATP synthase F1 subunit gamma [Bacteroidota bacterium]|nr:ATP synthase F1 subunit gamma [Bacteroidota bacterium]